MKSKEQAWEYARKLLKDEIKANLSAWTANPKRHFGKLEINALLNYIYEDNNNGKVRDLVECESKYTKAVVQYFRTVYESDLMRFTFIKNKVWRMKYQNPQEYKKACELLGVDTLFSEIQGRRK